MQPSVLISFIVRTLWISYSEHIQWEKGLKSKNKALRVLYFFIVFFLFSLTSYFHYYYYYYMNPIGFCIDVSMCIHMLLDQSYLNWIVVNLLYYRMRIFIFIEFSYFSQPNPNWWNKWGDDNSQPLLQHKLAFKIVTYVIQFIHTITVDVHICEST